MIEDEYGDSDYQDIAKTETQPGFNEQPHESSDGDYPDT